MKYFLFTLLLTSIAISACNNDQKQFGSNTVIISSNKIPERVIDSNCVITRMKQFESHFSDEEWYEIYYKYKWETIWKELPSVRDWGGAYPPEMSNYTLVEGRYNAEQLCIKLQSPNYLKYYLIDQKKYFDELTDRYNEKKRENSREYIFSKTRSGIQMKASVGPKSIK